MSYSKLVEYVKLSPNCTKPRSKKVDAIVIHHMAGNATIEAVGALFAQTSRQASSNYGIGTDGRVACYVEEENRSWATCNAGIDNRAITIEVANCSGEPDWKVSDKALESTIALCVDICKRYGFKLNYTGNKNGNLHMHKWYAATGCPGAYLASKFQYIANEVNKRLGENIEPSKPVVNSGCTLNLPVLHRGSEGESVKALQILLIGKGYSCGGWGADGDFGLATEEAVRKFQRDNGLTMDGIVGTETWSKLLGA